MPDQIINLPPDVIIPPIGVSQVEFQEHKKDFEWQKKILNWTSAFIVAVLIVCFLGFITFLSDAWKFHSETTKEYSKTLEGLRKENYELRINDLSKKVKQLENKIPKTVK